jgi:hypothetical protein
MPSCAYSNAIARSNILRMSSTTVGDHLKHHNGTTARRSSRVSFGLTEPLVLSSPCTHHTSPTATGIGVIAHLHSPHSMVP